jgi:hypothetical protein
MKIQGRHEGSTCTKCRIEKGTVKVHDGPEPGSKILRIEDDDNPAFWIDVFLSELDIVKLAPWRVGISMQDEEKET